MLRSRDASVLLLLLVLAGLLPACGGPGEPTDQPDVAGPAVYNVRGMVREVRHLGEESLQLSVFHEAIPGFIGITGDVVGMKSMTMPFAVDAGVDLSGIEAGSKIDFELSVDWSRREPGLITAISLLPEDTELVLGTD